jgi:hypothetical protein
LNSATSIWSSVTDGGFTSFAIFDSVSPRRTWYSWPGCADVAARLGCAAGRATGVGAAACACRAWASTGSTGVWTWTPGRIEQERIAAHDAARGPRDLDDEVEERLGDRRGRGDAQIRAARPCSTVTRVRASAGWKLHVVLAVQRRVGDARGQRVELVARRGGQLDPGGQRLAEARFDGEPAEAQRVHVAGAASAAAAT